MDNNLLLIIDIDSLECLKTHHTNVVWFTKLEPDTKLLFKKKQFK